MSKSKRAPVNVAPPKGPAMPPEVPEVLPPDGWVKRSPLGFLGYAGGDLARLGDVLVWMERTKGLPRAVAVRELVRDMPEDVMASLYYISRADEFGGERYADLMPPDSTFSGLGSLPSPPWRSEQEHQTALEAVRLARNPNAKTGRAALAECLKRWATAPVMEQTDPVNNPTHHVARLAVPMAKAYQWWGYGQLAAPAGADTEADSEPDVSTWEKVVAFNSDRPGVWPDEACKTAAREEKRRKDRLETGVRIAMGAELVNPDPKRKGLTAKTIGEIVKRGEKLIAKEQAEAEAAKAEAEKARTLENRRNSGGF